ncbi:uncharacterized protein METZ01_LOCUS211218 [marine metagenome]|uniref:DUF2693 domain-containing protein n=1 Tax=marine metagenome TaxID=408172 RepID=A0A382F7R7_9ZZZZ
MAMLKGIPTQDALIKTLQEKSAIVTFLKLDGDERIMTCTKDLKVIPEANHPKTDKKAKEGNVNVWDLNAKGWRSFKYDRVKKVEINEA